jgi:hypothetical protein
MIEPSICKVCGFPAEKHEVRIRWGVAHTFVRGADDKELWACSEAACDYNDFRGQISTLTAIRRSLRWRAGRLRSEGTTYHHTDLDWWANKITVDITRLQRLIAEYYAWTKEEST